MSCSRRCAAPCSRCMPRQGPEYGGEQAPSRDAWPLRRRALSLSTQTADDIRGGGGGCRGRCRGADRSKGWGGNAACAAAAHSERVGGSDPCESELSRGGLASLHETRTCKSEVAREPADARAREPVAGIPEADDQYRECAATSGWRRRFRHGRERFGASTTGGSTHSLPGPLAADYRASA